MMIPLDGLLNISTYHKLGGLLESLWMAWNLTCWCILTTLRADLIWVILYWFGHFLQDATEQWPELWHADVSGVPFQLLTFWSWSVEFPHFGDILKQIKFAVSGHFLENALEGLAEIILWYPKKWKRQIPANKNYPVPERGVSLTAV